jgi:hypothetical protein
MFYNRYCSSKITNRGVAQVVERLVRDQEAGGSSPLTPTRIEKRLSENEGR